MIRVLISVLGFALAGGIFIYGTNPKYDSIKVTKAQIVEYDAALAKADELKKRTQELLDKRNKFAPADVERLQKLLPDHVDNIALILDLDSLAAQYSMPLTNVDVSTPTEPTTGAADVIASASDASGKYDSLKMQFSTRATYSTFIKFLTDLEASLRTLDLESLSVAQTGTQSGGAPVYDYAITMRTYWLK